jgi:hypothetical protein
MPFDLIILLSLSPYTFLSVITPRKEKGSYLTPLKELQQNKKHGDRGCMEAEHKADSNSSNLRP